MGLPEYQKSLVFGSLVVLSTVKSLLFETIKTVCTTSYLCDSPHGISVRVTTYIRRHTLCSKQAHLPFSMPALIESEHPACAHLIRRYLLCSRTAPLLGKIFLSQCTTEKYQLDACFREEKAKRTKKNIEKAKVWAGVCLQAIL